MTTSATSALSRRDYFAAHAPADIPPWFQFAFRSEPSLPNFNDLSPAQQEQWHGLGDWLEDSDVDPLVLDFRDRYHSAQKARLQYEHERAEAMFIAWRWHYADIMLRRNSPCPRPDQTTPLRADHPPSWLDTIWNALHAYRADSIPETNPDYDSEWSDICSAMEWLREDLGLPDQAEYEAPRLPPLSRDPYDEYVNTALCIYEHFLDRYDSDMHLERLRSEIGSVEMRALAIRLAPFCQEVHALLPDSVTFDRSFDWDIIPEILDTIDFAARPVTPPPIHIAENSIRHRLHCLR